ncbi:MAG: hypothetical protein EXQ69_08965 [Acidimicrobiia bacterium]|nr:hypothetical protein [Acidimicrobiia bacterium]
MHDIVNLEALGIPGVFVASTEFITAAETQALALGADPARVFVDHPIQDRTDSEIAMLAEESLDAIIAEIVRD